MPSSKSKSKSKLKALESAPPRPGTHVALLRGINVGGKNMLPMPALSAMFIDAGCSDVQTYIQSGNVVFVARPAVAKRVPSVVCAQVLKRCGFEPRIMVRTGEEMAVVAADNPLLDEDVDFKAMMVGFLDATPPAALVAMLDPKRSPGDRFHVSGREIYLHLRNGVLKSKYTGPYFDSRLKTSCTFRNWSTVLKLAEMTRSAGR